jgi:LysR family hca operon transcriptional activator
MRGELSDRSRQRSDAGEAQVGQVNEPVRTPELRQMRYLVAVADAGQLTEAARRLGVAQPTLSQALAQLESHLGVVLLERGARGITMTDVGARFVERSRRVLIAADEAAADARAMRRARSQELVIGRDNIQPHGWSPLFFRLHRDLPEIDVKWETLEFPRAGKSPLQHTDAALLTEPPPYPGVSELLLDKQPRVALLSARHRLASRKTVPVKALLDEVMVGADPSMDPAWRAIWYLDRERGSPARTTADRVTSLEETIEIVASGRAICTAPAPVGSSLAHPGVLAVPITGARSVAVKLIWATATENPWVETLVALASELLEESTDRP